MRYAVLFAALALASQSVSASPPTGFPSQVGVTLNGGVYDGTYKWTWQDGIGVYQMDANSVNLFGGGNVDTNVANRLDFDIWKYPLTVNGDYTRVSVDFANHEPVDAFLTGSVGGFADVVSAQPIALPEFNVGLIGAAGIAGALLIRRRRVIA